MGRPARAAFVGRDKEITRLRAALDRARDGYPNVVLLGGEAGVGKSRLVAEFVAESPDAFVAIGGSPPGGESELPFMVVSELLREVAHGLSETEADEVLGPARPFLAPLLPGGASSEADGASRTTLFEGILGSVERLAAVKGPIILVLEDLHWADRSTRELLAYLVHSLRDGRILLVATYRADDVPVGHPLRVLLAELDRSERVTRFELARFDPAEVRALLASLGEKRLDDRVVAAIASRSDGNPYFVEELAWTIEDLKGAMPTTLRELLRTRVTGLPSTLDQVLRLCAAFGPEIDHRLIAAMAPVTPHDLGMILRDAIGRNLLVSRREGDRESYVFRHTLLHEVVYEDMLAVERGRYHRAIATVLEAHPEYMAGPSTAVESVIAYHWLRASSPGRARGALVRAGIAAEDAFAFPEAAFAYETALRLWDLAEADVELADAEPPQRPIGFRAAPVVGDAGGSGLDRREISRRAATVVSLAGRPGDAAALMRAVVTDDGRGEAAGDWLRLGRFLDEDGDIDGALAAYDQAADLGSDQSRLVARVAAARAGTLAAGGRYREARVAAEEAIGLAGQAGSESAARNARESLGIALAMDGDVEGGLAELAAARRSAAASRRASMIRPRPSQIGEVVRGRAGHAAVLDRVGRPTEFGATAREGADLARALGVDATLGSAIGILEARSRFLAGEWDVVERALDALAASSLGRADEARMRLLRAWLATGRGAFEAATTDLELTAELLVHRGDPVSLGELAAREADLAIWRSQLTEARDAVDRGISRIHETEDQVPIIGLAWLGIRAEADRAETDRARRATADLAESTRIATALRAEVVALRARLADRTDAAPRELRVLSAFVDAEWTRLAHPSDPAAWATAVSGAASIREPWLVAYGQWREAEAILAGRGARGQAESLVRDAYAAAVALEAAPLATELAAVARRARIDLDVEAAPVSAPKPSARDTLGLTEREIEVLGLVAEGYTNRRIAEELFITEKTAGHHVSNVLGKLGAATRVEAAAMAHRLGLLDGGVDVT